MSDTALAPHPTPKEELWKYTPVKEIIGRLLHSSNAQRESVQSVAVTHDSFSELGTVRYVFVNGFYREDLSTVSTTPGVSFSLEANEQTQDLTNDVIETRTIEGLYDGTSDYDVAYLNIDENTTYNDPIHIIYINQADNTTVVSHPRCIIHIGNNSHINLVETYRSNADTEYISDSSTIIRLGDDATLDMCRVQIEAPTTTHVGYTRIVQGTRSKARVSSVTIGSDIARNAIDVRLNSPEAELLLTGVNLTDNKQKHDTVVTVKHSASYCRSNQKFFGVVSDNGRGSFSGEITVAQGTIRTDAHQTNKNLLLSQSAQADTRPWLWIYADDVQCTHGATVGRLDDNSLFYLQSRGIDIDTARTMLVDAFINEITESITHEGIRKSVSELISQYTHRV